MATTHPIVLGTFNTHGAANYLFTVPLGVNYQDTICVAINCTATVNTVSDTAGNVYANIGAIGNQTVWLSVGVQPLQQNVSQLIVGVSSSSNFINIIMLNLPGPNVVDVTVTASGVSTMATVSTGTINFTDDPSELVLAFAGVPTGDSVNWSGGVIPLAKQSTASAAELSIGFGNLQGGATSMTPLATLGTSGSWSIVVCTFATRSSGAMNIVPVVPNSVTGTVKSPGLDTTIATLAIAPGTYQIPWSVSLSGTISGTEANNMQLILYPSFQYIASASYSAVAGTHPQPIASVTVPAGQSIIIQSLNPGTSGAIYGGTIIGPWPSVPTITQLNQLSYAASFLVNCAVRPAWCMFKKLLLNCVQNSWASPNYGNTAFDSDKVSTTSGAVINTQGYYLVEACAQVNTQVPNSFGWAFAFLITYGPNNPYHTNGTQRWFGFRSSGTSTVAGQCDAFTITDITPGCLYPGDIVTTTAWTNATGVQLEPMVASPNFMSGVFAFKFTGYWIAAGP